MDYIEMINAAVQKARLAITYGEDGACSTAAELLKDAAQFFRDAHTLKCKLLGIAEPEPAPKKRVISPEGKERIRQAQKRR